jgi:hypothetical protein
MKPAYLLASLALLLSLSDLPAFRASADAKNRLLLKGSVDVIDSSCNAAGITLSSKSFPSTVQKVRLGSPALYAGIAENDKVTFAQINGDRLVLEIERGGQKFCAYLPTAPVNVNARINESTVPRIAARAARGFTLGSSALLGGAGRRGMYMHVGSSPVVWTRMGLCGSWDANGDGRQRFLVLAGELFRNSTLSEGWEKWQNQIALQVQQLAPKLGPLSNAASVHLVMRANGYVEEYSPYDGPERPYHDAIGQKETERLIGALRSVRLPAFPSGSQAEEAHVLIYLTNSGEPSVFEGH